MKPLLPLDLALVTADELERAHDLGLLRKSELTHGRYYRGSCRNSECARWHGAGGRFVYVRRKFGQLYLEAISHPADEQRYDVFVVIEEVVVPEPEQRIDDGAFETFFSQ